MGLKSHERWDRRKNFSCHELDLSYEPCNIIILSCPSAMEKIVIANIQSSWKRAS
jgi:hypothetical protein